MQAIRNGFLRGNWQELLIVVYYQGSQARTRAVAAKWARRLHGAVVLSYRDSFVPHPPGEAEMICQAMTKLSGGCDLAATRKVVEQDRRRQRAQRAGRCPQAFHVIRLPTKDLLSLLLAMLRVGSDPRVYAVGPHQLEGRGSYDTLPSVWE